MWNWRGRDSYLRWHSWSQWPEAINGYLLYLVTLVWTGHSRERTRVLPPLYDYHFGYNIKRLYISDLFLLISCMFKIWSFHTKIPFLVFVLSYNHKSLCTANEVILWLLTWQLMKFDHFSKIVVFIFLVYLNIPVAGNELSIWEGKTQSKSLKCFLILCQEICHWFLLVWVPLH